MKTISKIPALKSTLLLRFFFETRCFKPRISKLPWMKIIEKSQRNVLDTEQIELETVTKKMTLAQKFSNNKKNLQF